MLFRSDQYQLAVGQYPNALAVGDECTTAMYIVYNNKMVTVNVKLTIIAPPTIDWNSMENKATYSLSVSKYPSDGYSTTSVAIDLADAAEKLGTDQATLVSGGVIYALDGGGDYSTNYTQSSTETAPGFWFNAQGLICGWRAGTSDFYVTYIPASSVFEVGGFPGENDLGDEYETELYLVYGGNYVTFKVNLTYIEKPVVLLPTICAEYSYLIETTPADSYSIAETVTVSLSTLAAAMEIPVEDLQASIDLYTEDANDNLSDAYSCTPHPGFWLDADGKVSTWGSSSPVGVTFATSGDDAIFTFYQYPNANVAGSEFPMKMYLVNAASNKCGVYNLTVKFVEKVTEYTLTGSSDVAAAMLPDDYQTYMIPIDFSALATSLGVPEATLKSEESQLTIYGTTASGGKTSLMTADAGYWMTRDGVACEFDDPANAFGVEYYALPSLSAPDYDNLHVSLFDAFEDGDILQGTIYVGYPTSDSAVKVHAYNVKVYLSNDPTSIAGVEADAETAGDVYDLSGRLVSKNAADLKSLPKGIYIKNGKKYIVR